MYLRVSATHAGLFAAEPRVSALLDRRQLCSLQLVSQVYWNPYSRFHPDLKSSVGDFVAVKASKFNNGAFAELPDQEIKQCRSKPDTSSFLVHSPIAGFAGYNLL